MARQIATPPATSGFSRDRFLILQLARGGMIVKYLPDNLFDWFLFHAKVVHLAVRKNDPTCLRDFVSRDFQLNRGLSSFDNLAKLELTRRRLLEGKTQ